MSLMQIKAIIDDPAYDRATALKMQIEHLEKEKEKIDEKLMLLKSAVSETVWSKTPKNIRPYLVKKK